MNNLRSELLSQGYTLSKANINPEKILELRDLADTHSKLGGIRKHHGVRQPHAFRKAPFITKIFEEKSLIDCIDTCLDSKDWYITNHADLHSNALSGWHKDDGMSYGDGGYFNRGAYDLVDPKVFKVAIYFQNHSDFNDGLTVVPGSHRSEKIYDKTSPSTHLDTEVGDIVIFDPRLSHTGQLTPIPEALTASGKSTISEIKNQIDLINQEKLTAEEKQSQLLTLFRSKTSTRSSIFFTVATEAKDSNIFAINNMERQIEELGPDTSPYLPPHVTEELEKLGVKTIDNMKFWKEHFNEKK